MLDELRSKLRSSIVLCKIILEMLESAQDNADDMMLESAENAWLSADTNIEFKG